MINIGEINIEYKITILFGLGAMVLSFLIGLLAGNAILLVILRTLIFTCAFSAIGFAGLYVIKKYVPEMYEIFDSNYTGQGKSYSSVEENNEDVDMNMQEESALESKDEIDDTKNETDDMNEGPVTTERVDISESDIHLKEIENENNRLDFSGNTKQNLKYEPKIAAQAIRTMMKRDDN